MRVSLRCRKVFFGLVYTHSTDLALCSICLCLRYSLPPLILPPSPLSRSVHHCQVDDGYMDVGLVAHLSRARILSLFDQVKKNYRAPLTGPRFVLFEVSALSSCLLCLF